MKGINLLAGQKFGRLTLVKRGENNAHNQIRWVCICDCGTERLVLQYSLRNGATLSCGCLHKEAVTRHGHAKTGKESPEYLAWSNAKWRTTSPNHPAYANYGGRGITMADDIANSFELFLDHMGRRPSPQHSLDRIKNDRGYEIGNMRWATWVEQNRNQRSTKLRDADIERIKELAKTQTQAALAAQFGVNRSYISRILSGTRRR